MLSDVRIFVWIIYFVYGGEIVLVFLRGAVYIFFGSNFVFLDIYQINVGLVIVVFVFFLISCCLVFVWYDFGKDCIMLKIIRVFFFVVYSNQVKISFLIWERVIVER